MGIAIRTMGLASAMLALSAGTFAAGDGGRFLKMNRAEAEELAAGAVANTTVANMWIWADRYTYQPQEVLTLRWTVVPNGDLFPVTWVVYRQNNQTGERIYFPNRTAEVTDMFGRAPGDFDIVAIPAVEKQVLLGAGGTLGAAVEMPADLGMYTFVVEMRDYTGNRVLKRAYFKVVVVSGFENLNGSISTDRTLVNTVAYRINGTVFVENGATLTIEPGTVIIGLPGTQPPNALVVTRGSRLMAVGTRSRPIIFTSSLPFGQRRSADWGGIAVAGRSFANEAGGEGTLEGLPAGERSRWGGTDPEWSCGKFRYIRIEFGGAELEPNREINAIGWSGCGTGTEAEYIQGHYSSDDGFEWFGGTMNAKHLVSTGNQDDNLDIQLGYSGKIQYFVTVQHDTNGGDNGIEADNNETNLTAEPYTNPTIYNATFIGQPGACVAGGCDGARLRLGLKGSYNNIIFNGFHGDAIDLRDGVTQTNVTNNQLTLNGIIARGNNHGLDPDGANDVNGQFANAFTRQFVSGQVGTARNVEFVNPMFRSMNPSDWDLRPAPGSTLTKAGWVLPPDDGFFDQNARYIGAFDEEDWTEEWTMKIREVDMRIP